MNGNSKRSFWSCLHVVTLACAVLFGASGCATDPEYSQKLATARTDYAGSEIVGIWVGKVQGGRTTLLVRPDGTGKDQWKSSLAGNHMESTFAWRYLGSGDWEGAGKPGNQLFGRPGYNFTLNYTGKELLRKRTYRSVTILDVFVRADDDAAVEERPKKR